MNGKLVDFSCYIYFHYHAAVFRASRRYFSRRRTTMKSDVIQLSPMGSDIVISHTDSSVTRDRRICSIDRVCCVFWCRIMSALMLCGTVVILLVSLPVFNADEEFQPQQSSPGSFITVNQISSVAHHFKIYFWILTSLLTANAVIQAVAKSTLVVAI